MPSFSLIQKRLKRVKSIAQITQAMELVAATKMRKTQEAVLNSRPYSLAALDLLAALSRLQTISPPALLEKREMSRLSGASASKKTLFVLVASDRGLAGAFNSSIFKEFENYCRENKLSLSNKNCLFLAVGEKSNGYLQKQNLNVLKKFTHAGDLIRIEEIKPISDFIIQGFLNQEWDRVLVFSTHFFSVFVQKPLAQEILPVDSDRLQETAREIVPRTGQFSKAIEENHVSFFNRSVNPLQEYLIEPSPASLLEKLVPHLVFINLYQLILEANAAEHAARRTAMKSAGDNSQELKDSLASAYNKVRQEKITRELVEIVSGSLD